MYNLGNSDKNMLFSKAEENKYYDENIKIDINDTNNTHSIIASYVKENASCLDVGCGAGYLGDLLAQRKCFIDGIEIDSKARKKSLSKKIYNEIYDFSIEDSEDEKSKNFFEDKKKYDYIIFADVLEHTVNPANVIIKFSKKLVKNGKILISVPNIAHLDIIRGLINKTFNYNKIGILDNTHLRFFTKSSFCQMVESINNVAKLKIGCKLIGKTINIPYYYDEYININNFLNDNDELCVLQYVFCLELNSNAIEKVAYVDTYKMIDELFNKKDIRIEELEKELKEEKEKNVAISAQLYSLNDDYNKVINSSSWKVTKPLRDVKKIINNRRF